MAELKQYLYRVEPTGTEILQKNPPSEIVSVLQRHVVYVRELTENGVVVLAGRTCTADETTFGLVIFNAESDVTASEIMNNDPGVESGLMQAKLFPYQIAFANITHAIRGLAQAAGRAICEPPRLLQVAHLNASFP